MSTEITQPQNFEQKLMDRIRASIGELMSDEDLKKIIDRGVEKALFQERSTGNGWDREVTPSLVDKAVKEFLSERMRIAIDNWIAANPDRMQAAVDNAIKAGVAGCLMQTLDQRFSAVFYNLRSELQSAGVLPQ